MNKPRTFIEPDLVKFAGKRVSDGSNTNIPSKLAT